MDEGIGKIITKLRQGDLIFITADHGNDPTTPSTDHSREHVPILAYRSNMKGQDLGTRKSFADLAKTIASYFGIKGIKHGEGFLEKCFA
jgi:phosphopentomutase